jgi:hypothetical protein
VVAHSRSRTGPHPFGRTTACVLILASALTALSALQAMAYTDNSNATPAQRRACTPDVYRLCAGEIPSVPKITACLRRNRANLSEACRAVFEQ